MSLSPDLSRLLRALTSEPLVLERRTLDAFVGVIRRRALEGASFSGPELHSELQVAEPRAAGRRSGSEGRVVQVIPMVGAIANRAHSMGVGAQSFAASVDRAAADDSVDVIVLDVDSPGGTVTGVPEAAERVFAARSSKPIIAVANGMMASAAYWIGSAAHEVVVTPSGEVGSIGVFALHEDWSAALEAEGVKVTEISAGKYKTEGAPWRPLDDEARGFFETRVSKTYDWFTKDVARFRSTTAKAVRDGYGEGRVVAADEAVAAGLADRVATLEETIVRFAAGGGRARGRMRADAELELEVDGIRRARARRA